MSVPINNGGPEFPQNGSLLGEKGMTLRDYFAAKAMHASMTTPADTACHAEADDWTISLAEMAYRVADAMLRAREAK